MGIFFSVNKQALSQSKYCVCLNTRLAPKEQRDSDSEKSLCENKGKCFGAKMKNKLEEQFIDPVVHRCQ